MKTKITTILSILTVLSVITPSVTFAQSAASRVDEQYGASGSGYQRDPCLRMLSTSNPSADVIAACNAQTAAGTSGSGTVDQSGGSAGASNGSSGVNGSGNTNGNVNGNTSQNIGGTDTSYTSTSVVLPYTQLDDITFKLAAIPGSAIDVYPIMDTYYKTTKPLEDGIGAACKGSDSSACDSKLSQNMKIEDGIMKDTIQKLNAIYAKGKNYPGTPRFVLNPDPSNITYASQDGSGDEEVVSSLQNQMIAKQDKADSIEGLAFNSPKVSPADFSLIYNKITQVGYKITKDSADAPKNMQGCDSDASCAAQAKISNSAVIKDFRAWLKLVQWEIDQYTKLLAGAGSNVSIPTNQQITTPVVVPKNTTPSIGFVSPSGYNLNSIVIIGSGFNIDNNDPGNPLGTAFYNGGEKNKISIRYAEASDGSDISGNNIAGQPMDFHNTEVPKYFVLNAPSDGNLISIRLPSYQVLPPGDYTIDLEIGDFGNIWKSKRYPFTVLPVVEENLHAIPNLKCSVLSSMSDKTGTPITWSATLSGFSSTEATVQYSWDGSDSMTGYTQNITKTYSTPGLKMAVVTAKVDGWQTYTADCSINNKGDSTVATPSDTPTVQQESKVNWWNPFSWFSKSDSTPQDQIQTDGTSLPVQNKTEAEWWNPFTWF